MQDPHLLGSGSIQVTLLPGSFDILLFEQSWLMLKVFSLSLCTLEECLATLWLWYFLNSWVTFSEYQFNQHWSWKDWFTALHLEQDQHIPSWSQGRRLNPYSVLSSLYFLLQCLLEFCSKGRQPQSVIIVNCILLNGLKGSAILFYLDNPQRCFLPILLAISED